MAWRYRQQQQWQQQYGRYSGGANLAYRTWQQWQQRGDSNVMTTTTAAKQTWIVRNNRAAARLQQVGSDGNGGSANTNLWQRLRQDSRNGFYITVADKTWFVCGVSNSNGSGNTAAPVAAQNWFSGPGSSGDKEVAKTARQQRRRRSKLVFAATTGRR